MQVTNTITVLEIVWTVVATFGLMFMGLLLIKSYQDTEWLNKDKNANGDADLRRNVAVTTMLIFAGGVVTQACYFITGCIAMTQPNAHDTTLRLIVNSIFITGSVVGSMIAAAVYIRRTRIAKLVEDRLALAEGENGNGKSVAGSTTTTTTTTETTTTG